MKLAEEKIVEGLLDFGFNMDEARAYVFLLSAGPCPASAVARKLGVNRTRAYRILKALQEGCIAEATTERPVKFMVAPLTETLNRLLEEQGARLSRLRKSKEEIAQQWNKLDIFETMSEVPRFRILQGRQQIYDLLLQMCERSRAEIRLITTGNDLYRLSFAGAEEKLKELCRSGVNVRLLAEIDNLRSDILENYVGVAKVQHIGLPTTMRFMVIDESEALTTFAMDDSMSMTTHEDIALWTNAFNYVKAIAASFDAMWANGVPAQKILASLRIQQTLSEGLEIAKGVLTRIGWVVEVPGRLLGESGVEYSFNLLGKQQNQDNGLLVLDFLGDEKTLESILTIEVKSLDVKPSTYLLMATESLEKEEAKLLDIYGIKRINAINPQQLAQRIVDEASKLCHYRND